jgi:large subunit ribosomal protein L7e
MRRTVPTQNDVLVPETLLKKRKSQEKARAERTAEQDKQKQVGSPLYCNFLRTT